MSDSPDRDVAIFTEALRLPAAALASPIWSFACGHDRALRRRVESLLEGFWNKRGISSNTHRGKPCPRKRGASAAIEKSGDRMGRYKLLQQIGEGGCGIVFMAEQEEPVRRRVALKIIKPGMDTKSVIARFEAERQALALMEHPSIAKMLRGRGNGVRPAVLCDGIGREHQNYGFL